MLFKDTLLSASLTSSSYYNSHHTFCLFLLSQAPSQCGVSVLVLSPAALPSRRLSFFWCPSVLQMVSWGKKMYFYFLVICVHVCLWLHEHKCRCPRRPERGRFSKAGFKVAMRQLTWVLGTLAFYRAVHVPNGWAISPAWADPLAAYEFLKSNFFSILRKLFPFFFKCFSNFVFIS